MFGSDLFGRDLFGVTGMFQIFADHIELFDADMRELWIDYNNKYGDKILFELSELEFKDCGDFVEATARKELTRIKNLAKSRHMVGQHTFVASAGKYVPLFDAFLAVYFITYKKRTWPFSDKIYMDMTKLLKIRGTKFQKRMFFDRISPPPYRGRGLN